MSSLAVGFEGRGAELEFLLARLSAALSGRGTIIAIAGEAGIGKTRLVGEFKKICNLADCLVLYGECIAGPPFPYLPFRDMLPRGYVVDSYEGRRVDDGPVKNEDRFPFQILGLIEEISKDRPLVIILEDMHWADQESASVLHFLGKRIRDLKVLMVCTYRPKEILSSGSNRIHPFYGAMLKIRKEGLCEEMVLGPLERQELKKIANTILDLPFESASLEHLLDCTGDNTQYFIETMLSMVSQGGITLNDGVCKIAPGTIVTSNDPVKQAVLGQMDLLTRSERRILELASVMGIRFDHCIVAEVLEQDSTAVSEMLDAVETRTDLIKDLGDGYCFSDTLTRDVIKAQISPMRQKEFLRVIGKLQNKQS